MEASAGRRTGGWATCCNEVAASMRERKGETAEAITVETVAASLWAFVNSRAEWWEWDAEFVNDL